MNNGVAVFVDNGTPSPSLVEPTLIGLGQVKLVGFLSMRPSHLAK